MGYSKLQRPFCSDRAKKTFHLIVRGGLGVCRGDIVGGWSSFVERNQQALIRGRRPSGLMATLCGHPPLAGLPWQVPDQSRPRRCVGAAQAPAIRRARSYGERRRGRGGGLAAVSLHNLREVGGEGLRDALGAGSARRAHRSGCRRRCRCSAARGRRGLGAAAMMMVMMSRLLLRWVLALRAWAARWLSALHLSVS
jgi:hypothetical protein